MNQLCLKIVVMLLPLHARYVAFNIAPGCIFYGEAFDTKPNVQQPHGFGVLDCENGNLNVLESGKRGSETWEN